MNLKADVQAMRQDAQAWSHVADVTEGAEHAAQALQLGESDMSWAARRTGLVATYEQLRVFAVTLLGEATDTYRHVCATLNQVADAYESTDTNSSKRLAGAWDPK